VLPAALALCVAAPLLANDRVHREIVGLISRQLEAMPNDAFDSCIYDVLESKRLKFTLCGNFTGFLLGLFGGF
jgi:hypothetical protein